MSQEFVLPDKIWARINKSGRNWDLDDGNENGWGNEEKYILMDIHLAEMARKDWRIEELEAECDKMKTSTPSETAVKAVVGFVDELLSAGFSDLGREELRSALDELRSSIPQGATA